MASITSVTGAAGNWTAGTAWVGGVAPTAADDAILASDTTSITIDTGAVCRSWTATAFTGTVTHTAGVTLTIGDSGQGAGDVALAFGTFTYTLGNAATSAISFQSSYVTAPQTINFNGKTTGNVTFGATAVAGNYQYITAGHVTGATATVTLTKGTLDINGQTCSWGLFSTSNTNVRSLTTGAAAITMTGGSADVWNCFATNLTIVATGSTITFTGATLNFKGVAKSYNNVVFQGSGSVNIYDADTYVNLTRTGTAAKTDSLVIRSNIIVSDTFTCTGNSAINRVLVQSNTVGTARTITAATVTVSNTDFQDITGAGAGSWDLSAQTDIGDCGGNSGITFPASVAQTWNGASGGNWSANAWTSRVPLPQDDVSLGVAFSASQTVTADMPRLGRSIDWTGATGSPTFAYSTTAPFMYGSLTLISGMSVSGTSLFTFAGRTAGLTVTNAGKTFASNVAFTGPSSTYTLQDALICTGSFTHNNGTLNANGNNVTAANYLSSTSTRTLTMGTGIWTATSTAAGNLWNISTTGLTFSGSSSTIVFSGVSANTKTFVGAGLEYGNLTYNAAGSTAILVITGSNSFNAINFSDVTNARTLQITAGTTQTIRSSRGFNVQGTAGKLMTVTSTVTPTGRWGDAVTLASSAAYSAADHADFKPTGAFSISGWVKSTNTAGYQVIFQSYSRNTAFAGMQLWSKITTGVLGFEIGKNTGTTNNVDYKVVESTTALTDGNWHFIVVTWDTALMKVYVDGTQEGGDVSWTSAPAFAATNYVRIGCGNLIGTNTSFTTGTLDDIALWNGKALSQAEITALYTKEVRSSTLAADASLKAYYRFETGALTTDETAGAHTLTAIASPAGTGAGYTLTSTGVQSMDYLSVAGAKGSANNIWYAGANSTDAFGTSYVIFEGVPISLPTTTYSEQQALNAINGSSDYQYTVQQIANQYNNTADTSLSFQEVLNNRAGRPPFSMTCQEALFTNVQTALGLTGPPTKYSIQELLNMCKFAGIPLATIFG